MLTEIIRQFNVSYKGLWNFQDEFRRQPWVYKDKSALTQLEGFYNLPVFFVNLTQFYLQLFRIWYTQPIKRKICQLFKRLSVQINCLSVIWYLSCYIIFPKKTPSLIFRIFDIFFSSSAVKIEKAVRNQERS